MDIDKSIKSIAILGGGPSALFMCKRLIEGGHTDIEIVIFEKSDILGAGMPYSTAGANDEHVTNVSDNEIPHIVTSIHEWVKTAPQELLTRFHINIENFNEYKVLPRLFFGKYLSAQFDLLLDLAKKAGISISMHFNNQVTDIMYDAGRKEVSVETDKSGIMQFDYCVICTGHYWPAPHESAGKGYYDSPYPPSKIALQLNHAVAIRGSSLTAIDAIRTLARKNGSFHEDKGMLSYKVKTESENFKMVLHSRNGMLPAVRFHLEDSHLSNHSHLTPELIAENIATNNGFLSLDFVFEKAFKDVFKEKDPEFYNKIQDQSIEEFVAAMMSLRDRLDAFTLFEAEFKEAEKSIRRQESVYWKEMLAVLSFVMNYPAKHFSAEDMQRLHHSLSNLIVIVIAFVPQTSAKELLALHAAGRLEIVEVGNDSKIDTEEKGGITYHFSDKNEKTQSVYYRTFIDSVGQAHLSLNDFPFKSLVNNKSVSQARLKFSSTEAAMNEIKNGNKNVEQDNENTYFLKVPGITINDNFQIVDIYGAYNEQIYMMAVPYISGFNPDYSGLDFCEAASEIITKTIFSK